MSASRITVCLIDDHSVVRNGIRLMLSTESDIEVTGEARSAGEAIPLIQMRGFDVAILDIELPDNNGLNLLKVLRKERPEMAILMFSMHSEDVYAERALRNGASGYLAKDCSIDTLVSAVRKIAGGGSISAPISRKSLQM